MGFDFNITTVTAGLGFVFNCFLIFLIIAYRNQANIGSFKWALVVLASFEALFAIDLIVAPPYFIIFDGTWIVLAFDTPISDDIMSYFASIVYCSLHQIWVGIIAALFLYRYLCICQPEWLTFLKKNAACAGLVFALYGAHVIISLFCGIIFCEHNAMTDDLRNQVINVSGLVAVPRGIEYLALNPKNAIGWVGFWNHIFIYYGSVPLYLFCSISMYITIRGSSKMVDNKAAMETQRRMFYLVLIQTLTPLLMSNSPFLAMLTFPLWSPTFAFTSTSTMMPLLTTVPKMIDPIAIILFVPSYRGTALSIFGCGKKLPPNSVVSMTAPASGLTV